MIRRYYRVGPTIWTDHAWDEETRYAAFYVLTCEHRTVEGLFRLPISYAAHDLGWTTKRVLKAFALLEADDFIEYDYDANVCLIVSALKWQAPKTANHITAALRSLEALPATRLTMRFGQLAAVHADALADRMSHGMGHGMDDATATA